MALKTKPGLIAWCQEYGIEGYEGKSREEIEEHLLENAEILMASRKEPLTKGDLHDLETKLKVSRKERTVHHLYGWASLVGLVLAIAGVSWFVMNPFETDKGSFDPSLGEYSILILPFSPLENCTAKDTHLEETLKNRLLVMSDEEGLDLQVKFYKGVRCPRTYPEGREIGVKFNADLVIWGDFYEQCSSEHEACLKYALVNQAPINVAETGTSDIEPFRLSEIITEGKLQKDIDFIIYWTLGLRVYERGEYHQARAYWEAIQGIENAILSYGLGHCYSAIGKREKAIQHYDQAIRLNPQYAYAFYNRGTTYYALKKYDLAIADYDQAIRLNPQEASAYYNTACAYALMNDPEKALPNLKHAFAIAPDLMEYSITDSDFNHIRSHPDFIALMTKFGKPEK